MAVFRLRSHWCCYKHINIFDRYKYSIYSKSPLWIAMNLYLHDNSLLIRRLRRRRHCRRTVWVREIYLKRNEFGEYHHIMEDLFNDPSLFHGYVRMKRETFEYILNIIRPKVTKYSNFRETISPEERLIVTLRYLATGSSFRALGYSFRISDNTVGSIIHSTCNAIWENLSEIHMKFPSSEDMVNITNDFWTKWRFPNCSGSIDGKHIRINAPAHSGSMYRNYKSFFSIVLQAVVDANYRFMAIDVGAYGKESDGGIFSHSNLSRQLENGALNTRQEKVLPGTDVALPHFLVGDEAYPLKTYLMRPYPQRNLGPEEEIFNKRLSNARQVVECAFGILSSKWRLLLKAIEVTPDRADVIIKCICLLHNIIIDKEGIYDLPAETARPQKRNRFMTVGENRTTTRAHNIRDTLKNYFSHTN